MTLFELGFERNHTVPLMRLLRNRGVLAALSLTDKLQLASWLLHCRWGGREGGALQMGGGRKGGCSAGGVGGGSKHCNWLLHCRCLRCVCGGGLSRGVGGRRINCRWGQGQDMKNRAWE